MARKVVKTHVRGRTTKKYKKAARHQKDAIRVKKALKKSPAKAIDAVHAADKMDVEPTGKRKVPLPSLAEIAKIKRERRLRRKAAVRRKKEAVKNGTAPPEPPPKPVITAEDVKTQSMLYAKRASEKLKEEAALKAKHAALPRKVRKKIQKHDYKKTKLEERAKTMSTKVPQLEARSCPAAMSA
eukprot:CAMPEP_0176118000 /NCGR_PEP_ID=MMETSP0120_2-20121206/59290_1 /TAXON_ID=160619 /ORGANISM="Kryptoperidinium foliaceum, Strain CCMP 1326" /LENGTH=183 /DNA_ID=CAMNT_0017452313 /DNA_START=65 /DNA_END=614 /DNA_ORIENTATION=+